MRIHRTHLAAFLLAPLLATHLVACSSSSPASESPVPPPSGDSLAISPSNASVVPGQTLAFQAVGASSSVTWSIAEGASGGSVSADGVYTAPATGGTFHIVATSAADPAVSGTATVTVTTTPGGDPSPGPGPTPDPTWANVMNFGAVGDGVHDDSAAFQAAANSGNTVWVPRPPAFYRVTTNILLKGSIIGDTSDLANLPMIRMYGADGQGSHSTLVVRGYHGAAQLVIAGLQIDNQYTSGSSGGEWDHNITVSDSDNVRITTNRLLNARGDGVCIGEWKRPTDGRLPELDCKNVIIENNYIYNPFRCGVAPLFTTAGSRIQNNFVRKLNRSDNGTYIPVFDIEPDTGPQNSAVYDLVIDRNAVDARTSDGAIVDLVWQVTRFSSNPVPIRGTVITNNYGYWGSVVPQVPPAVTNTGNNGNTDPSGWTMQPFGG